MFSALTIISLICYIIFINCRLQPKSVIFKNFWSDFSILRNPVVKMCINHSKIPIPILTSFTLNKYSHWAIGVWDVYNHLLLLSATGNKSIIVHQIPPKNISILKDGNIMFIDSKRWVYVINKDEIIEPVKPVSIMEVIKLYYRANTLVNYGLLNYNCHYQAAKLFNKFAPHDKRKRYIINPVMLLFDVIGEVVGSNKMTLFKSRLTPKEAQHYRDKNESNLNTTSSVRLTPITKKLNTIETKMKGIFN